MNGRAGGRASETTKQTIHGKSLHVLERVRARETRRVKARVATKHVSRRRRKNYGKEQQGMIAAEQACHLYVLRRGGALPTLL